MKKLSAPSRVTAFLTFIAFIVLCSVFMVRCKRELSIDQPKSKVEIPVDVMNAIRKKGRGFKMPVNISVPVNIVDNEGRIIRSSEDKDKSYDGCEDICDDVSCPGLEPAVLNHVLNWQKVCGDNYDMTVSFTFKTPFTLTDLSSIYPGQFSKGKIRLKNAAGTTIFQDVAIPIALSGIILTGTDPADPDLNIYEIGFTRQNVNQYFFNGSTPAQDRAVSFEAGFSVYPDCEYGNGYALSSSYSTPIHLLYAYGEPVGPSICDRVDYAYIIPTASVPGYNGTIAGTDVVGDCASHDVYLNTGSYIQYRKQGQSIWRQLKMYNSSGVSRNDGIIFVSELFFIKVADFLLDNSTSGGTGTYEFRYRNTNENPDICTNPPWLAPWSATEIHTF